MVALRVTSEFWISAFKKRLEGQGIPIFVIQKGDNLAGAIIIRVSNLCGKAKVFVQEPTLTGERSWIEFLNGSDTEIDEFLQNQIRFDVDLWILEVEEHTGINFFEEFLL